MKEERRKMYEDLDKLIILGGEDAIRSVSTYVSGTLDGCRIAQRIAAKAAEAKRSEPDGESKTEA